MILALVACVADPQGVRRSHPAAVLDPFERPPAPEPEPTGPTGGTGHTGTPPDDDPSFLFEPGAVTELVLELPRASRESLRAEPFTRVEGRLVYGDEVYDPVGVRLKGHGSFQPFDEKPSFKITVDAYDRELRFHGLETVVLNNLANDPTSMHEALAHRAYREVGVPDVRSGHAFLTVDGEAYGLYALDENVDEELLQAWYPEADGSMWEIFDADFTIAGVPLFEHEEGPDDRATLEAIGAALDTVEPGDWAAVVPSVDTVEFLRYWAVGAVIGQYDGYPYSFPGDDVHVYQDPVDGRIELLPHGCDETFSIPERPVDYLYGHLAAACLADPGCEQRFTDEVWRTLGIVEALDLPGAGAALQDSLAPWIARDTRARWTPGQRADGLALFETFLATREEEIAARLGPRPLGP